MSIEERTGRLTLLIDPRKKAVFEYLCAREDVTPSQVVRRMIREYIEDKLGHPWKPGDTVEEMLRETQVEAPPKNRALKRRVTQ
jgi:hypothetical protein